MDRLLAPLLATAVLLGCGGDEDDCSSSDFDIAAESDPDGVSLVDLGSVSTTTSATHLGRTLGESERIKVCIPDDTVTYAVFASTSPGRLVFSRFSRKGGKNQIDTESAAVFNRGSARQAMLPGLAEAILSPAADDGDPPTGPIELQVASEASTARVRVAIRRGDAGSGTLDVNLLIANGSGLSTNDLDNIVATTSRLGELLGLIGVQLGSVGFATFDGFAPYVDSFGARAQLFDTTLTPINGLPGPIDGGIRIYISNQVKAESICSAGLSSGLPGNPDDPTHPGVFISVDAIRVGAQSEVSIEGLWRVAAHETGHWLGLFHTSEATGADFDAISDTPECSFQQDGNGDGQVDTQECANFGSDNLMFWLASLSPTYIGSAIQRDVVDANLSTR